MLGLSEAATISAVSQAVIWFSTDEVFMTPETSERIVADAAVAGVEQTTEMAAKMASVMRAILSDSEVAAASYLEETRVPHGGE